MPQRTNPFQSLINLIEFQLSPQGARVTESKEFLDKVTGQKREVDIVIEMQASIHPFVIGIECTDLSRPIDDTWIGKIHAKHQNLPINKTIAVSRSGFYEPALIKAAHYNIETLSLEDALTKDWVKVTGRLDILNEISVLVPTYECKEVNVQVIPTMPPPYPPLKLGREEDHIVYNATDEPLGNIRELVNRALANPQFIDYVQQKAVPNQEVILDYALRGFDGSYLFDLDGVKRELAVILLKVLCRTETSTVPLQRANYGSTAVLHGSGHVQGNPIQVAFTESSDGQLVFGASIREPAKAKPHKPRRKKKRRSR